MNALLLATLLAAAPEAAQSDPYKLKTDAEFIAAAKRDLATLKQFIDGMERISKQVNENKKLFATAQKDTYSLDQKQTLLTTWGALFSYFSAAEKLRQRYWNFVALAPTDVRHAWGFVVTHTALTAMLSNGMAFAALVQGNKQLETLFDEANAENGLPEGSFAQFKLTSIHVATSTQLMSGNAWMSPAQLSLTARKSFTDPDVAWAWKTMKANAKTAADALTKKGLKLFAGNAADILKDQTTRAIFPAQKEFAEWAGDTRVARIGKPLVTAAQIEKILPKMEPGDVVVTRQNWFLSNIALPGFWPHAELYVGSAADLAKSLDSDPEVTKWAQSEPEKVATLSQLLEKRFPEKWKTYATGKDFQGHGPIRVIEAISEGVSFTATEHAFGVDYLGVIRPRLPKVEKAKAIVRAFTYQGRPYDFEFDFFSDATLVCSELVFKSYQPAKDMKGVKLDLVDVAGRRTLPANEIIKAYGKEGDLETRQFDFVAFLDGKEKDGKAVEADAAALKSSWQRLKWDIAQK